MTLDPLPPRPVDAMTVARRNVLMAAVMTIVVATTVIAFTKRPPLVCLCALLISILAGANALRWMPDVVRPQLFRGPERRTNMFRVVAMFVAMLLVVLAVDLYNWGLGAGASAGSMLAAVVLWGVATRGRANQG